MSKRFTESGKFRDSWYRNLTPKEKCVWEFLISECNAAGIFDVDFKSMSFHIGVSITEKDLRAFESRIVWVRKEKFFIPNFLKFQYPGGLNSENRAHKNILPMLKEYLYFDEDEGSWKPLGRPLEGAKDKETVKEQVTVQVKETAIITNENNITFEYFWNRYPKKTTKQQCLTWWKENPQKRADAIKGLEWYGASQRVRDGYSLDAIRYLKREVWNDSPEAYNTGKKDLKSTFEQVMSEITEGQEAENDKGIIN